MKRNIGLDLLKVLACFAIIVLHTTGPNNSFSLNYVYYLGGFAVPIFFMVNGCLLLNKKNINYNYTIKKIINILIVVFSWNFLLTLAMLILKKNFLNPFYLSFESMIQKGYFFQFWFFGTLIIIYLLLPLIFKYFQNFKFASTITIFFILISLMVDISSLYRSHNGYSIIQVNVVQTFRLWTWFAYYLLGGLLGKKQVKEYIISHVNMFVNLIIVILATIASIIYQSTIISNMYKISSVEYFYDNIFIIIWSTSLFILFNRNYFSQINNKIINLMSSNIMGVYILHITVINFIKHFCKCTNPISNILLILITFISSLIVSYIMSKTPIIKRLIKL